MNALQSHHTTLTKLGERAMPTDKSYPSPEGLLYINLSFSCHTETRRLIHDQHGQLFVEGEPGDVYVASVALTYDYDKILMFFSEADTAIRRELGAWPVRPPNLDEFTKDIVGSLLDEIDRKVCSENNVMDFLVTIDVYNYTRVSGLDEVIERSMEECVPSMIPATDLSIQSLESKTVRCSESCTICLDEISAGCEAVFLPCEHPFHGACVTKWLRASHLCPVCRYEMPTD